MLFHLHRASPLCAGVCGAAATPSWPKEQGGPHLVRSHFVVGCQLEMGDLEKALLQAACAARSPSGNGPGQERLGSLSP